MKWINKIAAIAVVGTFSVQSFASYPTAVSIDRVKEIAEQKRFEMEAQKEDVAIVLSNLNKDLNTILVELEKKEKGDYSSIFSKTNIAVGLLVAASGIFTAMARKADTLVPGLFATTVTTVVAQVVILIDVLSTKKMNEKEITDLAQKTIEDLKSIEEQLTSRKDQVTVQNLIKELKMLSEEATNQDDRHTLKRKMQIGSLAAALLSIPASVGYNKVFRANKSGNYMIGYVAITLSGLLAALAGNLEGEDKELVIQKVKEAIESVRTAEAVLLE